MFSLCIMGGCSDDDSPTDVPGNGHVSSPVTVNPQAVDLGLPSGTKWCDRNVGASSPEDFGGYFAWGETIEKKRYSTSNYAYFNIENEWVNIGNDISGTQYDVAHVSMGDSWYMPTETQIKELYTLCTKEWTKQNGVDGILVTGPNGRQIFLPAAGSLWHEILHFSGTSGNYWSSTLYPENESNAYILFFGKEDNLDGWYDEFNDGRSSGLSVRAVCK